MDWSLIEYQAAAVGFLVAFLLAVLLTPVVSEAAWWAGAVDRSTDARRMHHAPTPLLGGLAMLLAIAIPALALGNDHGFWGIMAGAALMALLGAIDDIHPLHPAVKFGGQIAIAAIPAWLGITIDHVTLPLIGVFDLDWMQYPVTIIWIVAIANIVNFIDGMDGLAATLGALIAVLLGLVAHSSGQAGLAAACAALAGALLGFLPHNLRATRPASIFLGDSGSASVGFLLASLAIKEDWAEGDPLVALATPVLIFSVLIYDMIQTTVSRVASGRVRSFRQWIDFVGRDHIHHRFTDLLGTQKRALALILSLALGLGLSALGLRRGDGPVAFIFLVHAALVLLVVAVLEGSATRVGSRRAPPSSGSPGGRKDR